MPAPAARIALAALVLALGGCAHAPADDPHDPLEPVNRIVYGVNMTADKYVLRPVAKAYETAVPSVARTGIHNFLENLGYPTVILNDLLQLKGRQALQDLCRFVLNTTFGVVGFIDIATPGGLPANDEDFGQTLGHWGVGEGWYLMLPLFGPSNNRDLLGRGVDAFSNPLVYNEQDEWLSWTLTGVGAVDGRAQLLDADKYIAQQLDPYVFVRTIYLQNRQNKVHDGRPPPEEYGFEEDFEPDDPNAAPTTGDPATDAAAQGLEEATESRPASAPAR